MMMSNIVFKETECTVHCHCHDHDNITLFQHVFDDVFSMPLLITRIRSRCPSIKNYSISIPDHVTMSCDLALDTNLNQKQLISYLSAQSSVLFGYELNQLYFDFSVTTRTDVTQNIKVVAAQRDFINQIRAAFDDAQLSLSAIRVNDTMNLLPWRDKQQHKQEMRLYFLACIFIVLISMITFSLQSILKKKITFNEKKIILLRERIKKPDVSLSFRKKLQDIAHFSLAKNTDNSHNNHIAMLLSDLANSLPIDVTLTQLTLTNHAIVFDGKSNQIESIRDYIANLQYDFSNCSVLSKKIQSSAHYTNPFDFEAEIICP